MKNYLQIKIEKIVLILNLKAELNGHFLMNHILNIKRIHFLKKNGTNWNGFGLQETGEKPTMQYFEFFLKR